MKLISNQVTTVIGLTFDSGVLQVAEVKRSNGSIQGLKQFASPLTLDPLRDDIELVAREIRTHLETTGISTKRCVIGIPARWALTLNTKLPAIEGEDLASFLELEAERGFACNVDELQLSSHTHVAGNGEKYATLIGVPKAYLQRLDAVLTAAQLKVVSLAIGVLTLPEALSGTITAEIAAPRLNVAIGAAGGVAVLRTIEGAFETSESSTTLDGDLVSRELRITLAQMPAEIRDLIRQMHVFGERALADQLVGAVGARVKSLGLEPIHRTTYPASHHGFAIPASTPVSTAFSLAAEFLSSSKAAFEFLPPKPSMWEQVSSKYSSRRLVYAGAVAGVMLLLVASAFLIQQYQLSKRQAEWAAMRDKVEELENLQNNARRFRPWHESSFGAMNIMRSVTEAFPEDGAVSAKMIEIRNGSVVSCTGSARDNQSLLKTIDRLRSSKQVRDLRVDQIRGKAPLQFTVNFTWSGIADEG